MLKRLDKRFIYEGTDFYEILLQFVNTISKVEFCLYPDKILLEPEPNAVGIYSKTLSSEFYSMEAESKVVIRVFISKGCCGDRDNKNGQVEIQFSCLSDIDQDQGRYFIYLGQILHLGFKDKDDL